MIVNILYVIAIMGVFKNVLIWDRSTSDLKVSWDLDSPFQETSLLQCKQNFASLLCCLETWMQMKAAAMVTEDLLYFLQLT